MKARMPQMQRGASLLKWLLGLFVLLLLGVLAAIWWFPASTAVHWGADLLQPLKLDTVSGRVWDGRAQASVEGQAIGQVSWQLSPLSLLGLDQRVKVQIDGTALQADLALESIEANQVRVFPSHITLPARLAQSALDIPVLNLHGEIVIDIEQAMLGMALPKAVKGRITWHDAAVSGAAQAVLGDLQATLESPPAGGLRGTLSDLGGPLQLDGQFNLDYSGYSASATLRARDGNTAVAEALQFIGQAQADGSRRFELKGSLL